MLFLMSTALAVASAFLPTTNALMMACNNTVNGVLYDLNPLHALGDIKVTPLMGAYDYYFNVCGAVQGPCASHSGAFACQVRKSPANQFEAVVAYSDTAGHAPEPTWGPSASPNGGVKLVFTNGDSCNLRQRVMNIDFQCDETGSNAITVDENPQCTFNFIFPTKNVCPGFVPSGGGGGSGSSSLSGGWIFIIILLVCSFVYIVAGCLYKRQRQGTSGVESCPNIDFWRELPRLCRDGCIFTWGKLRGLCGGGSGVSEPYETIK